MVDNTLVDAVTGKVAMPGAQKAHMLDMADTVHDPRMADGYRKLAAVADVGLDVELTLATANQPDLKAIAGDLGKSALWLREKAITRLLTRAAGADVGEVAKMSKPALRKAIEGADLETRRTLKAAVELWTAESATGRR
ncbi:MAG: hypothetical protein QOD92_3929 [Acidimicrobiaceae bacterium]|jgi:hypothetical protein